MLDLIKDVENIISKPTNRTFPIPVYTQVLVTLRFLAKGDFFSEIGDLHGISRSSVSRIFHNVVSAINTTQKNITFPQNPIALRKTKAEFYAISNFPNCVGAIDGTLIPIAGMSGQEEPVYVCRKNFHALNIQAVSDANLRFLNINAKFPGSTHDAFIFNNSALPAVMQTLPEGGWLLGDSGYPLKEYLLTPYLSPSNQQEEKYNKAHKSTRAVVERAFGILKSRFRCLHKSGGCLPFTPVKCSKVVECCFRLHNRAIDEAVPLVQGGHVAILNNSTVYAGNASMSGQQIRRQVANRF